MATVIFNTNNFHFENKGNNSSVDETESYKQDIATHIGLCLNRIPPKQLCRCLRTIFLLNFEELQNNTPGFKNFVTDFVILLARLDGEEDKQRYTIKEVK